MAKDEEAVEVGKRGARRARERVALVAPCGTSKVDGEEAVELAGNR